MGLLGELKEHRAIATAAAVGVIIVALVIIIGPQFGSSDVAEQPPSRAYFTTDDSSPAAAKAALFSDSIDKLPPFQKDGKEAYRAHIFSSDGGKTTWVAYLERYTPQGLKQMQVGGAGEKIPAASPSRVMMMNVPGMIQIKKPGGKQWIDISDRKNANEIMDVRCPDGSVQNLEIVTP